MCLDLTKSHGGGGGLRCQNAQQCYYETKETLPTIAYVNCNCELPLEFSYEMGAMGYPVVPRDATRIPGDAALQSSSAGSYLPPVGIVHSTHQQFYGAHGFGDNHFRALQFDSRPGHSGAPLSGYPPCTGEQPWDYDYCYGADGRYAPCQFIDTVDMEDFM